MSICVCHKLAVVLRPTKFNSSAKACVGLKVNTELLIKRRVNMRLVPNGMPAKLSLWKKFRLP